MSEFLCTRCNLWTKADKMMPSGTMCQACFQAIWDATTPAPEEPVEGDRIADPDHCRGSVENVVALP